MTAISRDTLLARNPDLLATDMDGDTVMMSVARGEYYGLGGIGGRVWALLERTRSVDELIRVVCSEYDVEETKCEADLVQFAGVLLQNGAVTLVDVTP